MKTYEFSIVASGLDPSDESFEGRFYDAGCDDATISFQKGHIIVDFARESASLEDAISSAFLNVKASGAKVNRVEPDPLVSLADISSRTGLTRAALTNYSKGLRASNFPAPVARVTSTSPLWSWSNVARWMCKNNKSGRVTREAAIEAEVFEQANNLISCNIPDIAEHLSASMHKYEEDFDLPVCA